MGKAAGRTGWRAAALGILLGVALTYGAAQAQAVTIHEIDAGLTGTVAPNHIAEGPDGNLWFVGHEQASIDRITPAGVLTEFFLTPYSDPAGITVGPDGRLWFTEAGFDTLGRINLDGSLTEFASNGITGKTAGITVGPEGNLWFSERDGKVGRVTQLGVVSEFSAGITSSRLRGITLGPDRNLWFAEESNIGRITPAGVVTEFSTGITPGSEPGGITAGPDGNLWFTERVGDRVGRITPDGVVTEFSEGITPGSEPFEITAGPDGNLWFTERAGHRIGRITPEGVVTEFSEGIAPRMYPTGITVGPENSLWFTEETGQLGEVTLGATRPSVETGPVSSITQQSATLNARANPDGQTVSDCHFDYGTSEAYGSSVPCSHLPGAGSSPVGVVASVGNLSENTTYHVRIVATNSGGTTYGADQTFTTLSAPKPTTGMLVGLDAGGWGSGQYSDVAGTGSQVIRVDTARAGEISNWINAGFKVIDDLSGPYDGNGVSGLDVSSWVANAVATVKANPKILAIEVLNEPGGEWFWGPEAESTANEAAYGKLLKAVHEAFVANFGSARPLILASYDGGHSQGVSWGQGVWNERTNGGINVGEYVDGITMHPYNWPTKGSAGARSNVERAHAKTGKPVYITEVGWDTAEVTEAEQAANVYNFLAWARNTGYVSAVTIFEYRDYTTSLTENDWGIETHAGARKLSYVALAQAAAGLPLNLALP